jgi:nitrite reductase (NADH) large subunit
MKAEMKKQGLAVNNHVCEHFRSRQECTTWCAGQIKSFDELLAKHGKGLGCDVQADGGQYAGFVWNDFVLKEHASLQDTNDYFLGNIQKDGTYSVVPRMAGRRSDARWPDRRRPWWPRNTASTPRSPAASASTCSAPAWNSCLTSGKN